MNKKTKDTLQVGRLAFRVEGDWWVAYWAMPTMMKDAIKLGEIALRLVEDHERRDAFKAIFQSWMAEMIKEKTGADVKEYREQPAPEHERRR